MKNRDNRKNSKNSRKKTIHIYIYMRERMRIVVYKL